MSQEISIGENSSVPIYMRIAESISSNIKSGQLTHGYRLPTLTDLSEELGVSRGICVFSSINTMR